MEPFGRPVRRSQNRVKTLSGLARLKDLRVLHQSCLERIADLEKQPTIDPETIETERRTARAVKSEIKALENSLTWGPIASNPYL